MALTDINSEGRVQSDLAIPPGEYLEEVIGGLGIAKDELARCMEWLSSKLRRILKGVDAIDEETALKLEKVLGVPAHIWLGLDREYQATREELKG